MSAETDFFDPNPVDAAQSVFIGEGDSLTTGAQWTPAIATAFPTWSVLNVATGGNTIADMQTQYAATVAPFYSAARGNNVVLMWGGTNDNTAGASAATIQSRTETYCNTATATGFQIIVVTMLPAASWDAARELVRTTFNTWLRANWQTFATAMVDIAAIPELADPNDTTYYSDGTHLTAAAYDLITPEFIQAIAGLPMVPPELGTVASQDALDFGPVTVQTTANAISLFPAASFTGTLLRFVDGGGNAFLSGIGHNVGGECWWMIGSGSVVGFRNSNDGTLCFRATSAGIYGADVRVGLSAGELMAGVGGCITTDTTQTGNVGTGEDTLQTYSLAASSLFVDGNTISFTYAGTVANNVNAKRIRLKWGGTTIFDSGALPTSAAFDWTISGEVIRTGAATQKCAVRFITNNATAVATCDYTTAAETLSGAVILLLTGEAVSNNDIVKEIFKLRFER